jgi:hypothetical protein
MKWHLFILSISVNVEENDVTLSNRVATQKGVIMTHIPSSTSTIEAALMASVIERVELALTNPATMNLLLARGITYSQARAKLIESTYARLSAKVGI